MSPLRASGSFDSSSPFSPRASGNRNHSILIRIFDLKYFIEWNITISSGLPRLMSPAEQAAVIVDDDSWRHGLCPDCGQRLVRLSSWKDHGSNHGWGSDWLAVRMRAAQPGETVVVDPAVVAEDPCPIPIQTVDDETWKAGLPS